MEVATDSIRYRCGNFYNVYPTFYLYTYPTSTAYGQTGYARLQLRHNDGVNCAFVDGHAKWLNRQTIEGDIGAKACSVSCGCPRRSRASG